MEFEEILNRIEKTEGFGIIESDNRNVCVYDNVDDKFLNYRNLNKLNLLELFSFSSLKVNKDKFLNILKLLDQRLFIKINKVYFVSNEKDLDDILDIYPEQCVNNPPLRP